MAETNENLVVDETTQETTAPKVEENNLVVLNIGGKEYKVGMTKIEMDEIKSIMENEGFKKNKDGKWIENGEGRIAAEKLRVEAEDKRAKAEGEEGSGTYNSENKKLDTEGSGRLYAEQLRVEEEKLRVEKEKLRVAAEDKRAKAEGEEGVYDSVKKEFTTKGSGRLYAEQLRVEAENKRAADWDTFLESISITPKISTENNGEHGEYLDINIAYKKGEGQTATETSLDNKLNLSKSTFITDSIFNGEKEVGKIYNKSESIVPLYCYHYSALSKDSLNLADGEENVLYVKNDGGKYYSYWFNKEMKDNVNSIPENKNDMINRNIFKNAYDGWKFYDPASGKYVKITIDKDKIACEANAKITWYFSDNGLYICKNRDLKNNTFEKTIDIEDFDKISNISRIDAYWHYLSSKIEVNEISLYNEMNYNIEKIDCTFDPQKKTIKMAQKTSINSRNYLTIGYFSFDIYYTKQTT